MYSTFIKKKFMYKKKMAAVKNKIVDQGIRKTRLNVSKVRPH